MFAPISMPSYIQTVHGLSYKVVRTAKQETSEDPQLSRRGNPSADTPAKSDDQPSSHHDEQA